MKEMQDSVKIGFQYTNLFGDSFSAESQIRPASGQSVLCSIGDKLDTFLRQIGFVRSGTTVFMESVTEGEAEALADYLEELRSNKDGR